MADFILDGSVTMAWCFEDEATPFTDSIRDRLQDGEQALTSSIWSQEVANTLVVTERRRRLTKREADAFVELVRHLPIEVEPIETDVTFDEIWPLARQYSLSAYDASYLYLAIKENLPLASLDRRLVDAARMAGVTVLEP